MAAVAFVLAASNTDLEYVSVMFGNLLGLGVLLVLAIGFGAVTGSAIGSIEAAASFAIALVAANKGLRARSVYTTMGLICIAINGTFATLSAVIFLGIKGDAGGDFIGAIIVVLATIGVAAIFCWAQSLDWPEPIDLRESARDRSPRTDDTVEHRDFVNSLQTRLHEDR